MTEIVQGEAPVLTYRAGRVAVLTLNRPRVHNALDGSLIAALVAELTLAGRDRHVRAVVLTGAGDSFSSGDDLRELAAGSDGERAASIAALQRLTTLIFTLDKPVIGALNGPAFGAGLELALACDVRLATPSVLCATPEVRFGLTATNGASLLLPMLVGPSRARRMLLTGARVDAVWCADAGLVDEVVAADVLLDRATEVAREMSVGGPDAVAATRRLLNAALDGGLGVALDAEETACVRALGGPEVRAGLSAFLAGREPGWSG